MNKESGKQELGLMRRVTLMVVMAAVLAACGEPQEQVVADFGIAYIKRPIPVDETDGTLIDTDVREPLDFFEGGDVYIRDRASPSATEKNITQCLTGNNPDGEGDVRDLEVNYEGTKLIFSLREFDSNPNDATDTTWRIYEYDIAAGGCPTPIIDPADDTFGTNRHDIAPHYLPGGRIVFSSSRQLEGGAVLFNEGKSRYPGQDENNRGDAVVLHVFNPDSGSIKQISFNQSHDLDPAVLQSGKIVFSRWDNMGSQNAINLYTIRPDGTELEALYGVHNHAVGTDGSTVQYLAPRELADGKILAMLKPFTGSANGGAPVVIDVNNYADFDGATWSNRDPATGAALITGDGHVSAVGLDVRTDGSISPAGRFRHLYPLADGTSRALVSWSQCRLQDTDMDGNVTRVYPCPNTIPANAQEALPLYGIYIYDIGKKTQLPVVIPKEGWIYEEPVVLAPRAEPVRLYDKEPGFELDLTLADENVGLLHIRSVYDMDGFFDGLGSTVTSLAAMADPTLTSADERPARFLRIVKAVPIPDDDVKDLDNTAYGRSTQQRMREIVGYAPIEPDGSVLTKVPANIPFAISVVDKDGYRIGARHQNWVQIRPGETLQCNGCHDHSTDLPHGYVDGPASINSGAPTTTDSTTAGFAGTDPTITTQIGETMAEARIRNLCDAIVDKTNCPQLSPSVDLKFSDYWADPISGSPIPDVNLRYADLDSSMTAPVSTSGCQTEWKYNCRIIINYETHIHPLWSLPRTDPGNTANPGNTDWTCTNCHNDQDSMSMMPMIPIGQLDLSDGLDFEEPDHFNAYRDLMFTDTNLIIDSNGQLAPERVVVLQFEEDGVTPVCQLNANGEPFDINGAPLDPTDPNLTDLCVQAFDLVDVDAQGPSMSVNGSQPSVSKPDGAQSGYFINFMLTDSQHVGMLSAAEMRLIGEWLDIGGQYYNNPFDAP